MEFGICLSLGSWDLLSSWMKIWQKVLIILTGSLLACGPSRITKLPVPQERLLKAYRLMAEADRMLAEGKNHLAVLKYIEATTLNPYQETIFNKLAVAYCRIGRYPQAKGCGLTIGWAPTELRCCLQHPGDRGAVGQAKQERHPLFQEGGCSRPREVPFLCQSGLWPDDTRAIGSSPSGLSRGSCAGPRSL